MGIKDDINLILRDHEGYTGDGRGGVGELPIGDRSTARKPISKRDLREVLGAVHDSVADPAAAAMQAAEDAEDAADRAELAAAGVEHPVSYAPQTLTAAQRAQARANIGVPYATPQEAEDGVRDDVVISPALMTAQIAAAGGAPLGSVLWFTSNTPPTGWLVCDGTAVTGLYPDLRAFLLTAGSPYGSSGADPLLPDLRGEFVRGWDGGRGADTGRVFGSAQGDDLAEHGHPFAYGDHTQSRTNKQYLSGESNRAALFSKNTFIDTVTESVRPVGGAETRPRNVALLPCIRAYASVVNVPGQVDLDNILQQTQVIADATAAAAAAWRRVGKVNVGTGAAVAITGLDLTKETLFIVSYVKNSGTASSSLRLRASEDGGATWLPTWQLLSASANWNANALRGSVEMFPDRANGKIISSAYLSGANGANDNRYAPVEAVVELGPIVTPDCDTIDFHWSAGNFAASGVMAPEPDCIIIYQRG